MSREQFDVIVIGAGQGGGPLASAFASDGRKTALIEREYPGGTCVNWGCTPTKTMIASARVAHMAGRSADFGVNTSDIAIDMSTINQRTNEVVESFRSGSREGIESTEGLDYIEGDAHFVGKKSLHVMLNDGSERELHAETIVIDVGERDRELDIEVPADVTLETARTILKLDRVPDELIVIGGGPIALEFAQLFRRLGSEVTIVNRGPSLLSKEDSDIQEAVADILTEDGIKIMYDSTPSNVKRDGSEIVVTTESKNGGQQDIRGSHVLVATGRVPNTDTLNVDKSGIELDDKGSIPTNARLESNVPGIYAIGDVRPGPKFTHISYDDYRVIKTNLIDDGDRTIENRLEPATTFIDPQLGTIGLTEKAAKDQGIPYHIASMPMSSVARAIETDETRGLMKVLIEPETGHILGAAILGIEGGEIISMLQIAMMGNLPYTALQEGIFAHPGLAEALNNVFGAISDPE